MDEERAHNGRESPDIGQKSGDGTASTNEGEGEVRAPQSTDEGGPQQEPESSEASQRELDELRDQLLRLRAEFDNFRKRTARERQQIRDRASEHVIKDLLPVIDDLERACESIPVESENGSALKEGIELVLKSLWDILGRHGLQEIKALFQPFDPNFHEAVMAVETEDHPDDTVIEETQKGYSLGDRVIRPSHVVVAKPIPREE